ncbi:uncharacterized protein [Clytia hemisphaerica]|uniref:Uncharacterized protein n=1 Tax=Clytia hemisphaerica TaxID=252671 RepID=A0A7M6DML2_9CNID|eukprot:TCONS_00058432-protein
MEWKLLYGIIAVCVLPMMGALWKVDREIKENLKHFTINEHSVLLNQVLGLTWRLYFISLVISLMGFGYHIFTLKKFKTVRLLTHVLHILSGFTSMYGSYQILHLFKIDKSYIPDSRTLSLAYISSIISLLIGGYGVCQSREERKIDIETADIVNRNN